MTLAQTQKQDRPTNQEQVQDKVIRHRLAQNKYRQKQLAARTTCKQSLAALEVQLAQWKTLAAEKRSTALRIQAQLETVSSTLATLRAQRLLADEHEPAASPVTNDTNACQNVDHTPPLPSQHTPSSAFAELQQGAVPRWFTEGPGYVRSPCSHTVNVCVTDTLESERAVLAKLAAFRAGKARQLGCAVEDVSWAFRSERHPALTEEEGVTSHLGSRGCLARFLCLHLCNVLEWTCLVALAKRLDAATASPFGCRQSRRSNARVSTAFQRSLPDATSAPWHPAMPPASDCAFTTACTGSDAASAITSFAECDASMAAGGGTERGSRSVQLAEADVDMVTENMCRQLALDPNGPNVAAVQPCPGGGVRARIEAAMRQALRAILERYLPRMGGEDARRVLSHVRSGLGLRAIRSLDPHEDVTPANAYVVGAQVLLQELNAAEMGLQAESKQPAAPANPAEAEQAWTFVSEGLEEVRRDYLLLVFSTFLDNPRLIHGLGQQMRANLQSFVKVEELSLKAYQLLALSHEQKCGMASALSAYRKHAADADAKHGLLVKDLDALLAVTRQLVDRLATHLRTPCDCRCGCSSQDAGVLLWQVIQEPRAPGDVAEMFRAQQGRGSVGPSDQGRDLLGLLPEVAVCERRLLLGLRQVQKRRSELLLQFRCLLWSSLLTPRQLATMLTAQLPFLPDQLRLPAMAATDIRSALVFNRPAPSALGPDPSMPVNAE